MIRLLYNLLWPLGLLFFLPGYLAKMFRRGGYRRNFGQRLGIYSKQTRRALGKTNPIWLHAVSVGEVRIGLRLAKQLQGVAPLVITTTTTTGYALAEKSTAVQLLYSPLDFWPVMRRAFRLIQPRLIVLVEAEVWPNLLARACRTGVPVILANARLSPRSERRFRRFRWVVSPLLRQLSLICVGSKEDAERWYALGVRAERVHVVGNIKYDVFETNAPAIHPPRLLTDAGVDPSRPVLFGGSTHEGEEQILADVFCCLRQNFSDLFLVLAPRHVERLRRIEPQLRGRNLRVSRRSAPKSGTDCLLIDTTGELASWYSVATVAFIGKSLTAHGGQNPVEAIVAGVPVLFGPHMENFAQLARQLITTGGAVRVNNQRELMIEAEKLLRDPDLREKRARIALEVIAPHRNATARTAELITAQLAQTAAAHPEWASATGSQTACLQAK